GPACLRRLPEGIRDDATLTWNTSVGERVGEMERDANAVYFRGGEIGRPSKLFTNALRFKQLLHGVGAQAVWDAVHLATAELMVRHKSGWGLASRPLHANTSTNALHYAFPT